ncbi:MAG: DUF1176 domain-containing protein [Pseudomonadota bacterium]
MSFLIRVFLAQAIVFCCLTTPFARTSKEVRDWFSWCDDALNCTMQTRADDAIYSIGFERSPKANSEAVFYFTTSKNVLKKGKAIAIFDENAQAQIVLDMSQANQDEGTWRFPGQNSKNEILNAMMKGQSLLFKYVTDKGPQEVKVSLAGVTGSALFVDEVQERIGKRDALQARGDGVPSDATTRVTLLRSSGDLPLPVLEFWRNNTDGCSEGRDETEDLIKEFDAISVSVENEAKLFMLPCGLPGAYNYPQVVMVFDEERAKVRSLSLPILGQKGPTLTELIFNTSWDDRNSTLSAFYKGRGIGDCGSRTFWYWEGGYYSNFELVKAFVKGECDGKNDDWPQIWPPE